jgi:hypothetical protein
MQGDERSNTTLKSTYSSMQKYEQRQGMQTGTVPSKLTKRMKKLNHLTLNNVFLIICI